MNAGRDYRKARERAQANADQTCQPWQIFIYAGQWWIERVDVQPIDNAEVVNPKPRVTEDA